jgi:hypothetical protein
MYRALHVQVCIDVQIQALKYMRSTGVSQNQLQDRGALSVGGTEGHASVCLEKLVHVKGSTLHDLYMYHQRSRCDL